MENDIANLDLSAQGSVEYLYCDDTLSNVEELQAKAAAFCAFPASAGQGDRLCAVTGAWRRASIWGAFPRALEGTALGDNIMSYGVWGQLCPVIAIALLLSARRAYQTLVVLAVLDASGAILG